MTGTIPTGRAFSAQSPALLQFPGSGKPGAAAAYDRNPDLPLGWFLVAAVGHSVPLTHSHRDLPGYPAVRRNPPAIQAQFIRIASLNCAL
jgi:hypothetical protein